MTSSAASDTDSARNRTSGSRRRAPAQRPRRPPPPGRCTSSSTTSGACAAITVDRRVDVLGLADDLDGVAELGAHAACGTSGGRRRARRARRAVGSVAPCAARRRSPVARHRQPHLGALARLRRDDVALPPWRSIRPTIDCRTPSRSSGTASEVEARPPVAHEDRRPGSARPRRRPRPAGVRRVLGRVDQASRGRLHAGRSSVLVERRVADRPRPRRRPPCASSTSAGGRARGRRGTASASVAWGGRATARSSRSSARASRADLARVVGVALDQRQRLQHRVVHVRRQLGPLLRPDPLPPLLGELAGRADQPRSGDQRDAGHDDQPADEPVDRGRQTTSSTDEAGPADDHEHHADDDADPRAAAGRRDGGRTPPAGPLRIVRDPPQHHHAQPDHQERCGDGPRRTEADALQDQDRARHDGAQREQGTQSPGPLVGLPRLAAAGRAGAPVGLLGKGHQRPERRVGRDAGAARGGQEDEGQPDDPGVDPEVPGEAVAHPAEQPPVGRPVQPPRAVRPDG